MGRHFGLKILESCKGGKAVRAWQALNMVRILNQPINRALCAAIAISNEDFGIPMAGLMNLF